MIKLHTKNNRSWLLWTSLIAVILIGLAIVFLQPRPDASSSSIGQPVPPAIIDQGRTFPVVEAQPDAPPPAPVVGRSFPDDGSNGNPNDTPTISKNSGSQTDSPADGSNGNPYSIDKSKKQIVAPTEFGNIKTLGDYMQEVMKYALPTGVALAIIMTIYAGIILMISQGSPDKVKEGQEIIQGAVLGLIVLVLARLLATYLYIPSTQEEVITPTQANQSTESTTNQKKVKEWSDPHA